MTLRLDLKYHMQTVTKITILVSWSPLLLFKLLFKIDVKQKDAEKPTLTRSNLNITLYLYC